MQLNWLTWGNLVACLALSACSGDEGSNDNDLTEQDADVQTDTDAELDAADDGGDTGGDDTRGADTTDDLASETGEDAEPDESITPPTCGTDSASALSGCAEASRLEADLALVARARPSSTEGNAAVRQLAVERLEELGFTVEEVDYGSGVNVVATLTGTSAPEELVIISAHYDSVPNCPGADDNGTGVVGALEAARVLAQNSHDRTLVVGLWDEEERGLVGSRWYVAAAYAADARIVNVFNFEMIGYYDDEPDSQSLPAGFDLVFPGPAGEIAANDNRGDFIALIGNTPSAAHMSAIETYAAALGMPAPNVEVTDSLISLPQLGDLRRSDHAAFWDAGWPAIMITDTADLRNPNYHCSAADDEVANLDLDRAARVVGATIGAVADALTSDGGEARAHTVPTCTLGGDQCDEGEKCNVGVNGSNVWAPICAPLVDEPVAQGESCQRPTNTVGVDDCADGLFCAFWGEPQSTPQTRACLALCDADTACAEGSVCTRANITTNELGVCIPTCDPFGDDCAEGTSCRFWNERWGDGAGVPTCHWTGTAEEGESCSVRSGIDCADGLACVVDPADGVSSCRAWCDDEHECPEGRTCTQVQNQSPDDALGFCQPS